MKILRGILPVMVGVAFLSTSTVALADTPATAPAAQATPATSSTTSRVIKGGAGATLAGAYGVLFGVRSVLVAAYGGLASVGITTAAPLVMSGAVVATLGGGLYLGTRAVVGDGPSPWVQGAPGVVSGTALLAVAGWGLPGLLTMAAAGVAGMGIALSACGIIAVGGAALLGYGIYRGYKAWKAAHAQQPAQPGTPATPPQPPVATGSGSSGTPQVPTTTPTGSGSGSGNGHHGPPIFLPLPGRSAVGSGVARNADTHGAAIAAGTSPQTANAGMHH